jgi:hypothetical protein
MIHIMMVRAAVDPEGTKGKALELHIYALPRTKYFNASPAQKTRQLDPSRYVRV